MKCFAIGDLMLPAKAFDAAVAAQSWNTGYESMDWMPVNDRGRMRDVVRRIETLGSRSYTPSREVLEKIRDVEVLFIHLYPVPSEMIEQAQKLKFIITARGGVENIDVEAAKRKGVVIINCPAHNAVAVAEYAVGLMLAESRNIARANAGLKNGVWIEKFPDSQAIPELSDSVVGIIGFGTIGRLVAERIRAFGSKILVYDPYVNDEQISRMGYFPVSKETLLEESDFVTLHGRINAGDPPVIGACELSLMKPRAYLINTARAILVDMDALYDALKEKRIMGAALDVFPTEPLPENYKLLELENVTLTNHRGGDTLNSYVKAPFLLADQFLEYLETGKTRFMIR